MTALQTTLGELMTKFSIVQISRTGALYNLVVWADDAKILDAASLRLDVLLVLLESLASEVDEQGTRLAPRAVGPA